MAPAASPSMSHDRLFRCHVVDGAAVGAFYGESAAAPLVVHTDNGEVIEGEGDKPRAVLDGRAADGALQFGRLLGVAHLATEDDVSCRGTDPKTKYKVRVRTDFARNQRPSRERFPVQRGRYSIRH